MRDLYYAHPVKTDADGVIAPWHEGQNGQLDERLRIAVDVYKRYPWVGPDKAVLTAPDFIYNSHWSITDEGEIQIPPTNDWMCGDLSQRAWSIIKGLTAYYRYSGDPIAFIYITRVTDYVLQYGLTSEDHAWPRFPIATPTNGKAYGQCVENTRIQLDLCARLGEDILEAYKLTGNEAYFDAVKHWGDLFAQHAQFDPEFPPWNRYVDPSVVGWSDKLTGSVTMILEFLDELIDTGYTGNDNALVKARDAGRDFVRDKLLPTWTINENWGRQYWDWDNPIMCGAVSMSGDYMLQYRDAFPNWKNDLRNILTLIFARNGVDPGSMGDTYHGAWAFPESATCCGTSLSYNQYTAGPTLIRYGVLAEDERILEIGRRMLIMATYDSDTNGVVKDGLLGHPVATGEWSNLAHPWPLCQVMEALAWMPETFGPKRENHIMRSTSVVNSVVYGDDEIHYTTFDAPANSIDVVRLAYRPTSISADGRALTERASLDENGFTVTDLGDGDYLVKIRHDGHTDVHIAGNDPHRRIPLADLTTEGAWDTQDAKQATDATRLRTMAKEAKLAFTFRGNHFRIVADVDTEGGQADLFIDGEQQKTIVDFWNPTPRTRQTVYSRSGLADGEHTVELVARGEGNPISNGAYVYVDSIFVSDATAEPAFGAGGGPREPQRLIFGYTGREDFVDSKGNAWRPGTEFVARTGYGTDVVEKALWTSRRTMYIGNTDEPEIYRYGLHGDTFWANITVAPGAYNVVMHFASTPLHPFLEQDKEGGWVRYVQDVDLNGERVLEAMDVAAEAGGTFRAVRKEFKDVAPRNGIIEVVISGVDGRPAVLQALEVIPVK